jgi:hypothetical protein
MSRYIGKKLLLSRFLCMYETFFCHLKGTRFLKSKVLSGIFGPKREVRKEWRRRVLEFLILLR